MRFAAVPATHREPAEPSSLEPLVRRVLRKPDNSLPAKLDSQKSAELPIDLDQRVRLVGEW